ncbi:MAG: hypothetical protein JNM56_08240 [Planctomycetia bacterium]|nr:hypothetical protein [Planctomycetia bacterium]
MMTGEHKMAAAGQTVKARGLLMKTAACSPGAASRWFFIMVACLTGCSAAAENPSVPLRSTTLEPDAQGRALAVNDGFIVPSATAAVEHVIACETGGWAQRLVAVPGLGAERVFAVPAFGPDGRAASALFAPWPTDDWLVGERRGRRAVLRLPGSRNLDGWGDPLFAKQGWERVEVSPERAEAERRRFDGGGNVLASPPLPGFPHGRLLVGRSLQQDIKDYFRHQRIQAGPDGKLLEIDTDWLKVGHVDEILAFVGAPGQPGFRVVLPDFEAGLRLLDSAPVERALFYAHSSAETAGSVTGAGARLIETAAPGLPAGKWKYVRIISGTGAGQVARIHKVEGRRITIDFVWDLRGTEVSQVVAAARAGRCETMPIWLETPDATSRFVAVEDAKMWRDGAGQEFPALVTAGELAHDSALRKTAKRCTARLRAKGTGIPAALEALGIGDDAVLRLPVIFSADEQGECAGALLPNPVNLVPLDNDVVLLRPFGPRGDPADDDSDLFALAWRAALQRGSSRPLFLDGWDALHRGDGGAHCGTNVIRRPGGSTRDDCKH